MMAALPDAKRHNARAELLLALAARCEAEEPSMALDAAICAAVKPEDLKRAAWEDYTASLDAAVTLVPEGFAWGVETFCGNAARVVGPEDAKGDVPQGYSDEATTKTPASALSAASLRALAALEGA